MCSGSVLTRGAAWEVRCGHVFRFSRNNFENAYWNIVDDLYGGFGEGRGEGGTSYDDMHKKGD